MNKIKEFCKKHKEVLVKGVFVAAGIGTAILLTRNYDRKHLANLAKKDVITWKRKGIFATLEEVKSCIDSNVDSNGTYAIFREGITPDKYEIIAINNTNVL